VIPRDGRLAGFLALFAGELLFTYLVIAVVGKKALLNSAWLSPRFFVFQFSAFFQIGGALLRAHDGAFRFVRYPSVRKLNLHRLARSAVLALCMTVVLLLFSAAGLAAEGTAGPGAAGVLAAVCARYFLGLVVLGELTLIFSMARMHWLRRCPGLVSFALLALEVLVAAPQLRQFGGHRLCIVFSWVFCANRPVGACALTVIAAGLWAYILLTENGKDLCLCPPSF